MSCSSFEYMHSIRESVLSCAEFIPRGREFDLIRRAESYGRTLECYRRVTRIASEFLLRVAAILRFCERAVAYTRFARADPVGSESPELSRGRGVAYCR